jgi:hypothetical protein
LAIIRKKRGHIPGGKPTPIRQNPSAVKHYKRLVNAGIEDPSILQGLDDDEIDTMIRSANAIYPMENYASKRRIPLKERKFQYINSRVDGIGDEPYRDLLDQEINDWELRESIRHNTLRKKVIKKPKSKRKICSCRKK